LVSGFGSGAYSAKELAGTRQRFGVLFQEALDFMQIELTPVCL
jgi:hypothetical protein